MCNAAATFLFQDHAGSMAPGTARNVGRQGEETVPCVRVQRSRTVREVEEGNSEGHIEKSHSDPKR